MEWFAILSQRKSLETCNWKWFACYSRSVQQIFDFTYWSRCATSIKWTLGLVFESLSISLINLCYMNWQNGSCTGVLRNTKGYLSWLEVLFIERKELLSNVKCNTNQSPLMPNLLTPYSYCFAPSPSISKLWKEVPKIYLREENKVTSLQDFVVKYKWGIIHWRSVTFL